MWISWAILYISWFCFSVFHPLGINDTLPHITSDFLNLLSGAMLVLCYLLMVVKSEPPHKVGWYNIVSIVICVCIRLVFIEAITTSGAHGQFTRLDGARVYFDSVDGLLVGMGTALFVGRLGSEFFDSSKWAIALLYGYAVIQLAYPFLEDETSILGPIFTIVTCIALLSKIILFSTVAKLISSGKLTYYMLEYRLSLSVKSSERDEIIADILTADGER